MPVLKTLCSFDKITLYTLSNEANTLIVKIIDYGATIVQLLFPDRNDIQRDLVLGFDDLSCYKDTSLNPYFGATIGRVANRIAGASYQLNGQRYNLYQNNGLNSLHGGLVGFDKRKWKLVDEGNNFITLQYISSNGEEGYPGTLDTKVQFEVTDSNELKINYQAKLRDLSDAQKKQTIVSMTNHSYFNLNGAYDQQSTSILDHKVRFYSNDYLEIDKNLIPTGRILPVEGTALEFNNLHKPPFAIGDRNVQYDHCFVLVKNDSSKWNTVEQVKREKLAAEVYSPRSGIKVSLITNEPSFQFYTGEFIPQGLKPKLAQTGKEITIGKNSGFCLEAQRFPNAINVDEWKNQVILDSEGTYTQNTIYRFEISDHI